MTSAVQFSNCKRGGYIVTKVRALDYDIENVVDVFHLPEFEEARENPMSDIVSGVISSNFDSGASFYLPCKVDKKPARCLLWKFLHSPATMTRSATQP